MMKRSWIDVQQVEDEKMLKMREWESMMVAKGSSRDAREGKKAEHVYDASLPSPPTPSHFQTVQGAQQESPHFECQPSHSQTVQGTQQEVRQAHTSSKSEGRYNYNFDMMAHNTTLLTLYCVCIILLFTVCMYV